ncbi:MAG: antibiotic biosynthesis monooxygenase [Rhodobiaceae bacterium]|jgi:quinol monooxygenase YgiN|nr:antibiotic biosynthesis monooxygenase [Rhodobiaceae bacterium]MDG1690689.1 antibiotic biosynthesis monooxygenase [Alphaproteobacteria bacterium]
MKVGYVATLKVVDGKQAEFEAAFANMQAAVKADEPGTLQYDLCQDEADATTYRVMEQYENLDARKVHGKSAAFGAAAAPLGGGVMAGAPEVVPVKMIG